MPSVSWSEVKLWRRCKKAHDYRYGQRLRRKRQSIPALRGTILHAMMDAYVMSKMLKNYTGPDCWGILEEHAKKYRSLFEEEREKYGDVVGDCETIFSNYLSYYKKDELKYEASEQFVATDLAESVRLVGYIDKVAVDGQGRRWLVDHKFVRTIPTAEDRFSELQLLIYYWAMSRWMPDKPVDGIIWDYVRTKTPAKPELLKSGELSKRKNIDTDLRTYMATVKEHKLNPADYEDMAEILKDKEHSFFERAKLPAPSKKMVENIVEDFRTEAIMIQHLRGVAPRDMSAFNCKTCEFKSLCEAEVRGYDADFIRKSQYEIRAEHEGDSKDGGEEDVE